MVALYGIGVDESTCEINDYGTVSGLAKRYVRLIQEIQPNGPYNLGKRRCNIFTRNIESVARFVHACKKVHKIWAFSEGSST